MKAIPFSPSCLKTTRSTSQRASNEEEQGQGAILLLSEAAGNSVEARAAPKGHVTLLVGRGSLAERFLVNVKLFNDPCLVALLEMAADELGDNREGVLRITCDPDHFQQVVSVISKALMMID